MRKFILFIALSTAYCSVFAQTYKTVKIGDQVWMAENLNVDTFRNGDIIPHAQSDTEWKAAGDQRQPAWCYNKNDIANGPKYGKFYNWYAVNDPRGLAPKGWHIPSDAEWTKLTDYLGGEKVAGEKMKSKTGWAGNEYTGEDGNGTNSSGFSGLPGGTRYDDGDFIDVGEYGGWWSSTEESTDFAWTRTLECYDGGNVTRYDSPKGYGLSVRCLKD